MQHCESDPGYVPSYRPAPAAEQELLTSGYIAELALASQEQMKWSPEECPSRMIKQRWWPTVDHDALDTASE